MIEIRGSLDSTIFYDISNFPGLKVQKNKKRKVRASQ